MHRVDRRSKGRPGTKPGDGTSDSRARGARAILNSKYAHRVTSALVSQKICCLQAHDSVFTRRVQMHRRHARTHTHIQRGASRFPRASLGVPRKRRRAIEMQTSGISCVLSSALWAARHNLPVLHFKGRHDTHSCEFERASDSDERQTRIGLFF